MRTQSLLLALLLLITSLSACSSKEDQEPAIAEIPIYGGNSVDTPEEQLLGSAKQLYSAGLFRAARQRFESLVNGYPLGPYKEFAQIKLADSYFEGREFEQAASSYEEFLTSNPSSEAIPYVLVMAARSNEAANNGTGRDISTLEKAKGLYERLLEEHPESIYAAEAKRGQKSTLSKISEHEKLIIDYYRQRENEEAASKREETLNNTIQIALNEIEQQEQQQLAASGNTESESPKILLASVGKTVGSLSEERAGSLRVRNDSSIRRIECLNDSPKAVFIYLNKKLDAQTLDARKTADADGKLRINLPLSHRETVKRDCFAQNDLLLSEDGRLELAHTGTARTMLIEHPDRIMVVLSE